MNKLKKIYFHMIISNNLLLITIRIFLNVYECKIITIIIQVRYNFTLKSYYFCPVIIAFNKTLVLTPNFFST